MSQSTPDESTPNAPLTESVQAGATSAATSPSAAAPAPDGRRPLPRWVPIAGLAVGGALLLGLVFSGGVAVGRILPDHRGPAGVAMGDGGFDRGDRGDRADRGDQELRGDRGPIGGDGLTQEQREQFRDEMIERWQELQQENG